MDLTALSDSNLTQIGYSEFWKIENAKKQITTSTANINAIDEELRKRTTVRMNAEKVGVGENAKKPDGKEMLKTIKKAEKVETVENLQIVTPKKL